MERLYHIRQGRNKKKNKQRKKVAKKMQMRYNES